MEPSSSLCDGTRGDRQIEAEESPSEYHGTLFEGSQAWHELSKTVVESPSLKILCPSGHGPGQLALGGPV